jgi:hypothetical protein
MLRRLSLLNCPNQPRLPVLPAGVLQLLLPLLP